MLRKRILRSTGVESSRPNGFCRDAPAAAACRHCRYGPGVAIFPQDAEQADQLIRIADERLYHLKHANHSKTANGSARTAPRLLLRRRQLPLQTALPRTTTDFHRNQAAT